MQTAKNCLKSKTMERHKAQNKKNKNKKANKKKLKKMNQVHFHNKALSINAVVSVCQMLGCFSNFLRKH